ncbi:MAG: hypothetical protein WDN45_05670 [Caulobacteraceae bacterium]
MTGPDRLRPGLRRAALHLRRQGPRRAPGRCGRGGRPRHFRRLPGPDQRGGGHLGHGRGLVAVAALLPLGGLAQGPAAAIDEAIAPALKTWAGAQEERLARVRLLFALDGARWNEERVLDRYELLYETGLAPEAARDRDRARGGPGAGARALRSGLRRADDLRPPPHPGHRPSAACAASSSTARWPSS